MPLRDQNSPSFRLLKVPRFIKDASLINKIRIPIVLFLILTSTQLFINYDSFDSLGKDVRYQNEVAVTGLRLTLDADKDLYQALVNERAVITLLNKNTAPEEITKRLKKRDSDVESSISRFKRAIELLDEDINNVNLKDFLANHEKWIETSNKALDLAKQGDYEGAISLSFEGEAYFEVARDSLDEVGDRLIDKTQNSRDSMNNKIDNTLYIQSTLASVLIIFMALVAWILPSFIAKPALILRDGLMELSHG